MKYMYDNKEYNVVIDKKDNKNIYIRVKENFDIYITCNKYTKDREIKRILKENDKAIGKMILKIAKKNEFKDKFYYLGKDYTVIKGDKDGFIDGETIYFKNDDNIDKWYLKQAQFLFSDRFDLILSLFKEKIPKCTFKIRRMKSRWGVCNRKNNTVTLNLELIKRDVKYLDYVIVHELAHFVVFDHSKEFWKVVAKYYPAYKEVRKEMKEY